MEEFFKLYDKNVRKFEWFIIEHFGPGTIYYLNKARQNEELDQLVGTLHQIWFHLPDNHFNIIKNPKGWKEFLELLEYEF